MNMENNSLYDTLTLVKMNAGLTEDFMHNSFGHFNDPQGLKQEDNTAPDPCILPERLASRIISLSANYPEIDFLLEKEGIGCISAGDIIVLKGKAKAGKTTAIICIISALLKGGYLGFKALKTNAKVLFVDTEQNPLNTAILARKVHVLCGFSGSEDNPRFHAFNLRADAPSERCKLIEEAVKFFTPDLLVVDGAKDLIDGSDINDAKASGQTIQFLMSLTKNYNLAILTTLHENKGDNNLRGHVGTELLNKCSECWQVRKYDDIFETEQTECRNQPAAGFSFTFDDEKLPVHTVHITRKTVPQSIDQKIKETFFQCLPQGTTLRYTDLKNKYIESACCSETSVDNHINKAINRGYLVKDEKGFYSFNHPETQPGYPTPTPQPL
jgi:hypothetical protein